MYQGRSKDFVSLGKHLNAYAVVKIHTAKLFLGVQNPVVYINIFKKSIPISLCIITFSSYFVCKL